MTTSTKPHQCEPAGYLGEKISRIHDNNLAHIIENQTFLHGIKIDVRWAKNNECSVNFQ